MSGTMSPAVSLAVDVDTQLRDIHALGLDAATHAHALQRCRRLAAQQPQPEVWGLLAQAPAPAAADWRRIVSLYDLLAEIDTSPEVARDRALARARCDGSARH